MVTSRSEVEQTVGRILRKIDINLRPIIYDFVDHLPSFINQSKKRNKLYNKMGFDINNITVIDNKIIKEELFKQNTINPIINNNINNDNDYDYDFLDND
jgi:CO dehydrogenase nickel-insertion accessory protein CooC1